MQRVSDDGLAFSPRQPVARVAADELAPVDADIKELRSAAIDFYRSRLQGRSVTNPELYITFTAEAFWKLPEPGYQWCGR